MSIVAVAMSAACSKKDAQIATGSPAECPSVDVQPGGLGMHYAMDNSAVTPAKYISIYKVQDPNARDRSYYQIFFNGKENVVFNGSTDDQEQPGKGALKANCSGGKFIVKGTVKNAGKDADGKPALIDEKVSYEISTDVNAENVPGLKVNEFHFTKTNAVANTLAQAVEGTKNVFSHPDSYVTGVPQKGDMKQPAPASNRPATSPQSQQQPSQQQPPAAPSRQ